jgi:hypothetical protein
MTSDSAASKLAAQRPGGYNFTKILRSYIQ